MLALSLEKDKAKDSALAYGKLMNRSQYHTFSSSQASTTFWKTVFVDKLVGTRLSAAMSTWMLQKPRKISTFKLSKLTRKASTLA